MKTLAAWQNFYVIMGSSAGALIGLQFVVLSLVASKPLTRVDPDATSTYSTPTIIHFSTVLTLAAILTSPWPAIAGPAIVYGLLGLIGVIYTVMVARSMRRQTAYRPEFEDWLFHVVLPLVAYATMLASAILTFWEMQSALFGVAAAVLLLLLIGIHNAWDTVTYHVFHSKKVE